MRRHRSGESCGHLERYLAADDFAPFTVHAAAELVRRGVDGAVLLEGIWREVDGAVAATELAALRSSDTAPGEPPSGDGRRQAPVA